MSAKTGLGGCCRKMRGRMPAGSLRDLSWSGNGRRSRPGPNTGVTWVAGMRVAGTPTAGMLTAMAGTMTTEKSAGDRCLVHQFLYFLFVLFFFFEIEHSAEDPVPKGAADAKSFVLVLVMVEMVVAPERLHPSKWRVPGMDSVVHAAIEEITKDKAGEEHEDI